MAEGSSDAGLAAGFTLSAALIVGWGMAVCLGGGEFGAGTEWER